MSSEGLTLKVYDPTNTTLLGTLSQVLAAEFVDEFNAPGAGLLEVPLSSTADTALLVKDNVVRVEYQGAARYAWFIESLERSLAEASGQQILRVSGRGLLAWLEDAVVYPQGGLADFNTPDRPFNYASAPGGWRTTGSYQNALGVTWRNDTSPRKGYPVNWKDPSAQWIWRTDPESLVQSGTVNWFYRDITLTESKRIKFFASADNYMTVWIDGNKVMSSSDFEQEAPSFTQMARYTVRLGVGTHTIAARVRNGSPWRRSDLKVTASDDTVQADNHGLANGSEVRLIAKSGAAGLTVGNAYFVRQRTDDTFKLATSNSDGTIVNVTSNGEIDLRLKDDRNAGFILTGLELDSEGKSTGVAVRTNTAWQVSDVRPYWRPAMILRTLMEEATTRGAYRFSKFTYGFDDTAPSSGSWTTESTLTLKVGSTLLTVLQDMVDLGHDFWVNPVTTELDAWESRGSDLSGTVALSLATNLSGFTTQIEYPVKTVALVRTQDGWTRIADSNLRGVNGWRELFLEYGNEQSEDQARVNAARVLRRTGKTQVVASGVDVVPVTGALPYVNFTVGDVVAVPNPSGVEGTVKARVLSIALKQRGNGVSFQPELEVITSA